MVKWLEVSYFYCKDRPLTQTPGARACVPIYQLQQEMEISMVLSTSFVRDLGRFQAQAGLLGNPGDKPELERRPFSPPLGA